MMRANWRTMLFGAPLLLAGSAYFRSSRANAKGGGMSLMGGRVRDIMTTDPAHCAPETPLRTVAEKMVQCDCGEIPVCDQSRKPIGVVTDRDIVCRLVAKGRNPLDAVARDAMSQPVVCCTPDTSISECARLMEQHQVRRLPVVDANGALCGMVAQGDLARRSSSRTAAKVVERVSEPNVFASSVGERSRGAQTSGAAGGRTTNPSPS